MLRSFLCLALWLLQALKKPTFILVVKTTSHVVNQKLSSVPLSYCSCWGIIQESCMATAARLQIKHHAALGVTLQPLQELHSQWCESTEKHLHQDRADKNDYTTTTSVSDTHWPCWIKNSGKSDSDRIIQRPNRIYFYLLETPQTAQVSKNQQTTIIRMSDPVLF